MPRRSIKQAVRDGQSERKAYRGYSIELNALSNAMWIEKDGYLVAHVPPSKSWAWARQTVDALVDGSTFPNPARRTRRTSARRTRRNPPLAVFANPGGTHLSERAYALEYQHAEDGKNYRHDFGAGVCVVLLKDGSVLLRHKNGKPLWGDF